MKRSRMKPGKPPTRKTPVKKRNAKRARAKYERNFGAWADVIRKMPCAVAGQTGHCWGPIQAHHTRTRGAGGAARDLAPLCSHHHQQFHDHGRKWFEREYGIDMRALAALLWSERNDIEEAA